jgi:hypothetical protein
MKTALKQKLAQFRESTIGLLRKHALLDGPLDNGREVPVVDDFTGIAERRDGVDDH